MTGNLWQAGLYIILPAFYFWSYLVDESKLRIQSRTLLPWQTLPQRSWPSRTHPWPQEIFLFRFLSNSQRKIRHFAISPIRGHSKTNAKWWLSIVISDWSVKIRHKAHWPEGKFGQTVTQKSKKYFGRGFVHHVTLGTEWVEKEIFGRAAISS